MPDNLKTKVIKASFIQISGGIVQVAIRLVGTMILARILTPEDYGTFALVALIFAFFSQVSFLGSTTAIVSKRFLSSKQINTIFYLNILIHILIFLAMFYSSNQLALFFNKPILSEMINIVSFLFLLMPINKVSDALLNKQMKFISLNVINIMIALIEVSTSLILVVYYQFDYWALFWAFFISQIIKTFLYIGIAKWFPSRQFSMVSFLYFLRFGYNLAGENITIFGRLNIDKVLIGKFFDTDSLGLYTFSSRLPDLVTARLMGPISAVIMPTLATLKNDHDLIRIYLKFTKILALFGFLIFLILFILSEAIIVLMWGEQWIKAVELMKILVLVSAISMLGSPMGSVFLKKSRPDLLFRIGIIKLIITFCLILIMAYWLGFIGIAYGAVLSSFISYYISLKYMKKIVPLSFISIFKTLKAPLSATFITAISSTILYENINHFNNIIVIGVCSFFIISLYFSILYFIFYNDWLEIKNIITKFRK